MNHEFLLPPWLPIDLYRSVYYYSTILFFYFLIIAG